MCRKYLEEVQTAQKVYPNLLDESICCYILEWTQMFIIYVKKNNKECQVCLNGTVRRGVLKLYMSVFMCDLKSLHIVINFSNM